MTTPTIKGLVTAATVNAVLNKRSLEDKQKTFHPADIALMVLKEGGPLGKSWSALEKEQATGGTIRVINNLTRYEKNRIVKSVAKVEPEKKHFKGIKAVTGYRVGEVCGNGRVTLSLRDKGDDKKEVNGNVGTDGYVDLGKPTLKEERKHPNAPSAPVNTAMSDALSSVLSRSTPATPSNKNVALAQISAVMKVLSFDELSEVILEATMAQQVLHDNGKEDLTASNLRVAELEKQLSRIGEFAKSM